MFGVYGSTNQYLKFSPESVADFKLFTRELAAFSDQLSQSYGSACVQVSKVSEASEAADGENVLGPDATAETMRWYNFKGPEFDLLNSIKPRDLLDSKIKYALKTGKEVCLYYSASTGIISQTPPVAVPVSATPDSAEVMSSVAVKSSRPAADDAAFDALSDQALFNGGDFDSSASGQTGQTGQTGQASQTTDGQIDDEYSDLIDEDFGDSFGDSFGQQFDQQIDRHNDDHSRDPIDVAAGTSSTFDRSVCWIRPLSSNIVSVSLCDISQSGNRLIDTIRNAHAAREMCIQKQAAEAKNEETRRIVQLANGVSESLPLKEQAYLQANEIRRYLNCDRVTIFDINNHNATTLAVSGQPKFNRRSNSIRAGQSMVGRIAKTREPFWFSGNFEDLADSVMQDVRRYTDQSLVNSFVIFPLIKQVQPTYPSEEEVMQEAISPGAASKQNVIGAVLVEQIEDVIEKPKIEERWNEIKVLTVNQFYNSRRYDSIFLLRLWTRLGRFAAFYRGQTRRKAIAITAAIATLVLAALLIPADFKIRCEGYLVFENTMQLYTTSDGNVKELNAFDGKAVKQGDLLLVLENAELLTESVKLTGRIAQLEAEIEDHNDARINVLLSGDTSPNADPDALAQEVRQMENELSELRLQNQLMQSELKQLSVTAPFDGTISGWKSERRLLGRPLQKGVLLFSLIPDHANFKLELRVPDQRAGYVQKAWLEAQEDDRELPVVFRLASAPGADHRAQVAFVSPGLERDEHIGYTLPIEAITNDDIPVSQRKSKTAVTAKVICGRRSFAYCKGYEALDWVKGKMFEFVY